VLISDVCSICRNLLLVDPVVLSTLPALDFTLLEPESNFLLGVLNGVGTVANVTSDIDGEISTDGTRLRGKRVGGTEEGTSSLDSITTFPNHSADGSASHILDKSREEGLGGEILVVLLKVLLAGSHQLDGGELVAALLESRDNRSNESTLDAIRLDSNEGLLG